MKNADRIVRIGGASGFWGDSAIAAPQLMTVPDLDYISFDYLAEVTMSLLARARLKDPTAGYATDFITVAMASVLPQLKSHGVRVLSNAGGVNPGACADALQALAAKLGIDLRIAVVVGDDVSELLRKSTPTFGEMFTGEPLPEAFVSANAYLGAFPIAAALDAGADVVITGRCVDSALPLGALIHEFGWTPADLDQLAGGSLVGHILECGAQATGGLHTDWRRVPRWEDIGYPVAECRVDGSFSITKPKDTGGLVAPACLAEQMLYEVGDPGAYLLPDVTCDFRNVQIRRVDAERVELRGAVGRPPPPDYKCSVTYLDGWRLTATLTIIGREAAEKAVRSGDALVVRTARMLRERNLPPLRRHYVEAVGAEASYGTEARRGSTREAIMRVVADAEDRRSLELMAREVAQAGTSWATGTTNALAPGRPKSSPIVRLRSCRIPKSELKPRIKLGGVELSYAPTEAPVWSAQSAPSASTETELAEDDFGPERRVPLIDIAYARSGDKGDIANIGVIARSPELLPILRRELTPERVAAHFAHFVRGPVRRYDVPGIDAFNFVLERALDGGGMASMRLDPLAKSFAQILLDLEVSVPEQLLQNRGSREDCQDGELGTRPSPPLTEPS